MTANSKKIGRGAFRLAPHFDEQPDDVVNDFVNFAAAYDAPVLAGKDPCNQLLHSFEVHDPIRFPRFTTVG
jgi:hypothetical protein